MVPWVGTAIILFYVFSTLDFKLLLQQFRNASPELFISSLIFLYLKVLLLEALTLQLVLGWFVSPTPFNQMVKVRGAINILHLLNVQAAMGGMYYMLARVKKTTFVDIFGAILFNFIVTAYVFVACVGAAYYLGDLPQIFTMPIIIMMLVAIVMLFYLYTFWGLGWNWPFLGWLRDVKIFHGLAKANMGHVIKLTLVRIPVVILGIIVHWFGLVAFGVYVPIQDLFILMPMVTFVAGLPISISGLGPTQASFIFFLSPYASQEALMAYSLSFNIGTILVKICIGLIFFRAAYRLIFPPQILDVQETLDEDL